MLTYTTTEAIARRMAGRSRIGGGGIPYQESVVDEFLLEQVGDQVEAKLNAVLRSLYSFPLALTEVSKPILASIVEKGVVCELTDVQFFSGEEGNSYGKEICRQYRDELAALADRSLVLTGEKPLPEVDTTRTSSAFVRTRTPGDVESIVW